jgi:hypothetical protein
VGINEKKKKKRKRKFSVPNVYTDSLYCEKRQYFFFRGIFKIKKRKGDKQQFYILPTLYIEQAQQFLGIAICTSCELFQQELDIHNPPSLQGTFPAFLTEDRW